MQADMSNTGASPDILRRLRAVAEYEQAPYGTAQLCRDAAYAIEQLTAERDALEVDAAIGQLVRSRFNHLDIRAHACTILADEVAALCKRGRIPYAPSESIVAELEARKREACARAEKAEAERDALLQIIKCALGEVGEFPDWPESVTITGNPKYWWRAEMRKRLDAAMRDETP